MASLVYYRIAFGLIALWECWRYYDHDWISRYYIEADFHFKYYGFEWVTPWSGDGMYWHFAAMALLSVMIITGTFYRLAAFLYWLAFTYFFLLERANYLNHFYLISLLSFLMILVPAHRAFSVDALRKPGWRTDFVPAWPLYMLRAQMVLVYFYAGVAKINEDWLMGYPLRLWLPKRDDVPIIGPFFDELWVQLLFSYGGLLLDLLGGFLLLHRRTRMPTFLVFCGFHLMNSRLFGIGVFPWFSIATTLLFFPPDWPRRVLARLGLRSLPGAVGEPAVSTRRAWVASLLALYFAVQILMPLRHWLYPGDVRWTEEGHQFSWRMKLRSKKGFAHFYVTDPVTGERNRVRNQNHLSRRQIRKMSVRPDLMLQFAHHIADEYSVEGVRPVVTVKSMVSVNGREAQKMVEPDVDLARKYDSLATKGWIVPLTATHEEKSAEDDD